MRLPAGQYRQGGLANGYGRVGLAGSTAYRRPYSGGSYGGPYHGGGPYYGGYRNRGPYINAAWTGWGSVGLLGYPYLGGFDDGSAGYGDGPVDGSYAAAADADQPGYEAPPPQEYRAPYAAYPAPYPNGGDQAAPAVMAAPAREPAPEEAVTLVFKDGRPTEQIHNYMLTRTTLYVRDQHRREIPLSELDVAATTKVNRAAGVDFQLLPASSQ